MCPILAKGEVTERDRWLRKDNRSLASLVDGSLQLGVPILRSKQCIALRSDDR